MTERSGAEPAISLPTPVTWLAFVETDSFVFSGPIHFPWEDEAN